MHDWYLCNKPFFGGLYNLWSVDANGNSGGGEIVFTYVRDNCHLYLSEISNEAFCPKCIQIWCSNYLKRLPSCIQSYGTKIAIILNIHIGKRPLVIGNILWSPNPTLLNLFFYYFRPLMSGWEYAQLLFLLPLWNLHSWIIYGEKQAHLPGNTFLPECSKGVFMKMEMIQGKLQHQWTELITQTQLN